MIPVSIPILTPTHPLWVASLGQGHKNLNLNP